MLGMHNRIYAQHLSRVNHYKKLIASINSQKY